MKTFLAYLFAAIFMTAFQGVALPLLEEGFAYNSGSSLGTNPPWAGGTSTNLTVIPGNLSMTNFRGTYPSGGMLQLAGGKSAKAYRAIPGGNFTNSSVYVSALINCTQLPTNAQPILSLLRNGTTSSSAPDDPADLYVTTNSTHTAYTFYVGHTGSDPSSKAGVSLATNTTHLIVLKYVYSTGGQAALFIDPNPALAEPSANITTETGDSGSSTIGEVYFNASSSVGQGTWLFDAVRVGTNWSDVVLPPIPLSISGPSNLALCAGSSATFKVTASGTSPITYQWRTNGAPVAGATASNYTLSTPGASAASIAFDVVVKDAFGSVTSSVAQVSFSTNSPTIISQPQSVILWPGVTNAAFSVSFLGDAPVSCQWRTNQVVVAGETNAIYAISNPSSSFAQVLIDAVVSNPCGSVTTAPVAVVFPNQFYWTDGLPGLFSGMNLFFTNTGLQHFYVWSSPVLNNSVTNWALEGPAREQPLNDGTGNSRYAINVNPGVSPYYYIVGTGISPPYLAPVPVMEIDTPDFTDYTLTSSNYVLDAGGNLGPPVLPTIAQNPLPTTAWPGSNAFFSASAVGSGPIYYQWLFNGAPIPGATATNLSITNVVSANAGQYSILATTAFGSVTSAPASLGVILTFYWSDGLPGLFGGMNLFFTNAGLQSFYAWSTPDLSVPISNWTLEGQMKEQPLNDGTGNSRYALNVNPLLSPVYYLIGTTNNGPYPPSAPLEWVSNDGSGDYFIFQTNAIVTAEGILQFPAPPVITQSPTDLTVTAGSSAVFAALATGIGPLSYQWFFNTNTPLTIATNTTLSLSNVAPAQAGAYLVVASNPYGSSTSSVALLTVNVSTPGTRVYLQNQAAGFALAATNTPGNAFQVFATTNLDKSASWTLIGGGIIASNGSILFTDTNSSNFPRRFYRLGFSTLNASPPVITQPPSSRSVLAGKTATLNGSAVSQGGMGYQWYFGTNPLVGATNSWLTIAGTSPTQMLYYYFVASNAFGSTTSPIASVAVIPPPNLKASPSPSGISLVGNAVTGDLYVVQTASNLILPVVWTPIATNHVASGGLIQFTDTNSNGSYRFYRVVFP